MTNASDAMLTQLFEMTQDLLKKFPLERDIVDLRCHSSIFRLDRVNTVNQPIWSGTLRSQYSDRDQQQEGQYSRNVQSSPHGEDGQKKVKSAE